MNTKTKKGQVSLDYFGIDVVKLPSGLYMIFVPGLVGHGWEDMKAAVARLLDSTKSIEVSEEVETIELKDIAPNINLFDFISVTMRLAEEGNRNAQDILFNLAYDGLFDKVDQRLGEA